jgi:hypothetical protein
MKLDEELVHSGAAEPLPAHQAERGWRNAIARLMTILMKAWLSLYVSPPRRVRPIL